MSSVFGMETKIKSLVYYFQYTDIPGCSSLGTLLKDEDQVSLVSDYKLEILR